MTLGVDVPVLAWATPTTIAGGRLQLLGALPELEVEVQDADHDSGLYNPFLAAQVAWDLGSGFGVSYMLGIYLPVGNKLGFDTTSITQRAAVSYTADGWNLTANGIYGIATDSMSKTTNPDFVNLDLTATKALGKSYRPGRPRRPGTSASRHPRIEAESVRDGRSGRVRLRPVDGAGVSDQHGGSGELRWERHEGLGAGDPAVLRLGGWEGCG